ncbi:MAG: sugar phosphate isomerase/epimerase family protein [Paracoccaceae bacterium]|jgi:sugar phosphate isomerase/epimerase|nr:sugar phosphate isomerase/epimerase family protein [Paracoccaceae bacterium]
MRFSLCNEVLREMSFGAQCDFAAALGYDGLEIAPFTLASDPRAIAPADTAEIRRTLADAGIACSSLHWLLVSPEGLSITTDDATVRRETVDVLRRCVDLAAELGAETLVHGSPKQRMLPDGDEAGARARAADCLRAAAEAAEAAGVTYCIEPLARDETNFVTTFDEAAALLAQIGSPAFRTMVDCAATGRNGKDPAALLDRTLPGGLIAHVQVNDPSRRGPGEGEMRFAPVLGTLKRHGYAGWVAVEPFVYVPDGPACAARSIGYLKGVREGLA